MSASSVSTPSVMYALPRLPAATGRWIRYEMRERRAGEGIRVHRCGDGARNDSERDEIVAAVATDADFSPEAAASSASARRRRESTLFSRSAAEGGAGVTEPGAACSGARSRNTAT